MMEITKYILDSSMNISSAFCSSLDKARRGQREKKKQKFSCEMRVEVAKLKSFCSKSEVWAVRVMVRDLRDLCFSIKY